MRGPSAAVAASSAECPAAGIAPDASTSLTDTVADAFLGLVKFGEGCRVAMEVSDLFDALLQPTSGRRSGALLLRVSFAREEGGAGLSEEKRMMEPSSHATTRTLSAATMRTIRLDCPFIHPGWVRGRVA